MKNTFKNYYIIQHPNGEIFPTSIRGTRKDCISKHFGEIITWNEAKKLGWKCVKVNLIFEIL